MSLSISGIPDVFNLILNQLPTAGLLTSSQVCTTWKQLADQPSIWESHSINENIPVVAGEKRDHKSDFRILRSITVGFTQIGRIFGECLGKMPKINPIVFALLTQPDPWEPEKTMAQTFVFVVVPKAFKKAFEQGLFNNLAENGDGFKNVDPAQAKILQEDMEVPCSHKNIVLLSGGKIFTAGTTVKYFDECNSVSEDVHIYFMRKVAPLQTRSKNLQGQIGVLNDFENVPLKVRMLSNAVEFAETKTCSDSAVGCESVRTSALVKGNFNVTIGCHDLSKGIGFDFWQCVPAAVGANLGAVPCKLAGAEETKKQ